MRKGFDNLGAGGLAKLQAPEAWFAAEEFACAGRWAVEAQNWIKGDVKDAAIC
ncbi:hypothetical protein INS49_007514 [Diaporthe citri]|uniref:uncharacterized protein n=1 Tax=Diaporthe citri TaxID=83186 RepID=UPI001C826B38|nr:uncharacterized protein INS49_007514 [Diaporthe citri]KAG6353342.1 hypothetical protein INS49_007514 [Diaporthe citri]